MPLRQTQLELERARVRDLLRYYRPNPRQYRPAHYEECTSVCGEVPEPLNGCHPVEGDPAESIPDDSQLLSHDPTLTAFAQLGAFRLDCQRSFISLMDHNHQYILAEATRSVSLMSREVCNEGDGVYLGARVLDLVWGVCPNAIQVFTAKDDNCNISTSNVTANQDCYVMNDMATIDKFKDRPYIVGWPYMRFYAEVPIHSPTGHVIGTYCVVDNKPRDGLDQKGLDALNEISSAIMKHLALVQAQFELQRAGAMVKGLGRFVEGKTRLQGGNGSGKRSSNLGSISTEPSISQTGTSRTSSTASETRSEVSNQSTSISTVTSQGPKRTIEAAARDGPTLGPSMASVLPKTKPVLPGERELLLNDPSSRHALTDSAGNTQLFLRASRLVRDALDMDGVIFLDACFRDIAIDPDNPVLLPQSPTSSGYRGIPDTPANEKSDWLDATECSTTQVTGNNSFLGPEVTAPKADHSSRSASEILAYSVKSPSNICDLLSSGTRAPLPRSTLRLLLQNYRRGHSFVFDEDGALVQGHDELYHRHMEDYGNDESTDAHHMEEEWIGQLLTLCPGARSIVFLPLWDPKRNRWFAGSLAWTKDPTRIIELADIAYLEAFGSCIMSEKARLEAIIADHAKSNFISSVSHELRSPLHGILASAEALQESATTSTQEDMIQTVMGCGEVLLDTVDQILDYAKESHLKTDPLSKEENKESISTLTTPLAFANLLENTVDAIVAGHDYRRSDFSSLSNEVHTGRTMSTLESSARRVMVILNIDWQTPGILKSQLSSWKRIIMNLCGNALKYTSSGFVYISLGTQTVLPASKTESAQRHITLQISDSGKGISNDYLKYDLFTPFSQEDQLAGGTGLGLSIVRQLVANFSGDIDVQSEVGYGTTVKVSVPINDGSRISSVDSERVSSIITDTRTRCKGLKLCIVGFEYYPDIGDEPTGILSPYARCLLVLKSSLTKIATNWFGMEVVAASTLEEAKGDVVVGLRSKWSLSEKHKGVLPLILVDDTAEGKRCDAEGVFSLSQIVGPQKLARVLALCLDYKPTAAHPSSEKERRSPTPTPASSKLRETLNGLNIPLVPKETPEVETTQPKDTLPQSVESPGPNHQEREVSAIDKNLKDMQLSEPPKQRLPERSKVLLVEDNIVNMKILVNYMKKAKQDYEAAANGLEALQIFQAEPLRFKVVFMDISMPVMDGLVSCQRMREHEGKNSLARTRIVALTCFSSAEYQEGAALSGFDKFLIKPVSMKLLQPILELDANDFSGG
ncbi:uncharacterized protein GIQ15_02759 [Arthroderma uncinatum]|uniref:uncharacterized protein n=1 Tax=Arthroderma uncinatum TaxID=74035 RepID=UPI00144A71A8|nr:uncharacterized protein GIQ15_02759 [Arthroderma uncinatum]KAF3483435.1 hypothetical protein GIQ15_02759 [Arthroderma uncinatum]